ncbi:polyribonucleotide nucleotidyltransferase [Helicobacter bilis]|uniref:Polyribonucleotide nucleotidyltransferase n=2 Tax=Helicobacter bilis TaxID=37372 RepID=A0A6D2CB38_9HELI|nr:polyribonucleotide nucleotidyltransferase [Helicobacter bilis]TLE06820.1 polyribonucleotide nucleotidyltransferase [Helicobacter bilis]
MRQVLNILSTQIFVTIILFLPYLFFTRIAMKIIEITNTQTETYILDKYATLADRSVMLKVGGSVLLCSVCVDYENPSSEDFLPLSVQYVEKMYAIGKIPQGFLKKEGKPSDNEILISRLIDRSLRPLFPKDYPYPVQITILVMSYDNKIDICQKAMNLASICLYLSSIPLTQKGILNGIRIMRRDDEFSLCDDLNDLLESKLDLFVSGINNNVSMIEMQSLKTTTQNKDSIIENANEISKDDLLEAINLAKKHIETMSMLYMKHFEPFVLEKREYEGSNKLDLALKESLEKEYTDSIKECLCSMSKTERHTQLIALIKEISQIHNLEREIVAKHVFAIKKEIMRSMILNEGKRVDGRTLREIREISIESNLLPKTHGSACFTRGQTQALVTCTLGSQNDAQTQEGILTQGKSKIIFHYNFPPFSVGEAYPIGASSRRELGHGNLALKAIESNVANTPHTIRLVSEILQSNGSSSMASVCGASLALLGADIKMHNMVAGIAMGLIYESEERFAILSDIMGLEDFDGDMDFKIAGNEKGFSALQLDIKIHGLSESILNQSLEQAREGILHILSLMRNVEIKPNYELLPQKESFCVPHTSIGEIIGQGGRTIRDIISRFQVSINIDKDEGIVHISANNKDSMRNAKNFILDLLRKKEKKELPYKVGECVEGVVSKQVESGFLVDLAQGGNGILRTISMQEELQIGQALSVRILSCSYGKVELEIIENKEENMGI